MNIILTRHTLTDTETVGKLQAGSLIFFTMEQPWRNNEKGHSCVPRGTYELHPHVINEGPLAGLHTWALHNPEVDVYAEPGPSVPPDARTDCLIHPANWAFQLKGCIAPGLGHLDQSEHGPMVTRSQAAFGQLRQLLGEDSQGHTLMIQTGVQEASQQGAELSAMIKSKSSEET